MQTDLYFEILRKVRDLESDLIIAEEIKCANMIKAIKEYLFSGKIEYLYNKIK